MRMDLAESVGGVLVAHVWMWMFGQNVGVEWQSRAPWTPSDASQAFSIHAIAKIYWNYARKVDEHMLLVDAFSATVVLLLEIIK